jgi:NADPH2:quinone reductase
MIKRKGTIVTFGNASGPVEPMNLFKLVEKNVKLLRPSWVSYISECCFVDIHTCVAWISVFNYLVTLEERNSYSTELWGLVSSGALKINIHTEYPFTAEGVRQAHTDLTSGITSGKLMIKVTD